MMLRNIFGLKGANRDSDNGFELSRKRQKNDEDSFLRYY